MGGILRSHPPVYGSLEEAWLASTGMAAMCEGVNRRVRVVLMERDAS